MSLKTKLKNFRNSPLGIKIELGIALFLASAVATMIVGGIVLAFIISPIYSLKGLKKAAFNIQMTGLIAIFIPIISTLCYLLGKSKRCYDIYGKYLGDVD